MKPQLAVIDENVCIGCTKCIQACPFDAIVGSNQQLHTVLTNECIGCGLCVPPCPVDCIEMIEMTEPQYDPTRARQRIKARKQRLREEEINIPQQLTIEKNYIQQALLRVKNKRDKI